MSNRLTDEMKEEMRGEIIDTLRAVQKKHLQNQKAKKNDTKEMQNKISELEILYREIDSNFQHFTPAIYQALGLRPPNIKIDTQPEPQSPVKSSSEFSEDDTASTESNKTSPRSEDETSSPRKKQPKAAQGVEYYDSEETGYTVNDIEEFNTELNIDPKASTGTPTKAQPSAEPPVSTERKKIDRQAATKASSADGHRPVVQQGWTQKPPITKETTPAEAMQFLLTRTKTLNLEKSTALTDALIDAERFLSEKKPNAPSDGLKLIMDSIGKKTLGKVHLNSNEKAFLKAIMTMSTTQDLIKDRKCLNILYDKAQSLPRTKRGVILDQLESVKTIAPAPTGQKK